NVTQKQVTATLKASDKNYDGNNTATITACTVSPVVGADDVACTASGGTFNSSQVALASSVTATVALAGTTKGNYSLTSASALATAHITPGALTINVSAIGTTYTGLPYAGATTCTADGVNGEHPTPTSS